MQQENINISGKGYWLFDRNGYRINPNEGFRPKIAHPKIMVADMNILIPGEFGPWAIYKWIPADRS